MNATTRKPSTDCVCGSSARDSAAQILLFEKSKVEYISTKHSTLSPMHMFAFQRLSEGGEVSWFAIGWELCHRFSMKERRSTVVISGLFWLVYSGPERSELHRMLDVITCVIKRPPTLSITHKRQDTHHTGGTKPVLQYRRYAQGFVFVLSQDLVIWFQGVPADDDTRRITINGSVNIDSVAGFSEEKNQHYSHNSVID